MESLTCPRRFAISSFCFQFSQLTLNVVGFQIVEAILDKTLSIENFSQHEFHPKPSDPRAFNWIFLIDTLNFCFWSESDDEEKKWTVDGQTGYFALCAAIKRAVRDGIDFTNPEFYSTITLETLEGLLKSDRPGTKAPLMEERLQCLHEVGTKLLEKYNGNFENVVKEARGSAMDLLDLIIDDFPCFRDDADYHGERVCIYKRAQILIGDVYACFRGEGLGAFRDLNEVITMFADYRVPQVLIYFKAMSYTDELMNDLKAGKLLTNGEEAEVEIRGASIYIVEMAKELVLQDLEANHPEVSTKNINSILIDHFLWDYRRANNSSLEGIPFHKTLSIFY